MKALLPTLLLCLLTVLCHAQFACAGLDRVDIYLNHKLVATATQADVPSVKVEARSNTDTLVFHAYTNWEGLRNCTLDIKDEFGELIDHVNSTNNNGYEALFAYVLNRDNLDDPNIQSVDIFLNLLCERDITPEQISTLSLASR